MVITNETAWIAVKWAVHIVTAIFVFAWLRKELTPRWVLSVVESEGVASARLILGSIAGIVTLCLQCADGRISHEMAMLNWEAVFGLFALGPVKLVGKAWASRPPEPAPQINAKKVDANAAGDLNIETQQTNTNPIAE